MAGSMHAAPKRWLSSAHFEEAKEIFNKYEPEEWLPTLSVSLSEFMRGPLLIITGVTAACTLLTAKFPAVAPLFSISSDAHMVLGGALAFLIVFRTNSSYDRWWEARRTWQNVCSTCRGLAVAASGLRDELDANGLSTVDRVCESCIVYCVALKSHLREEPIEENELGELLKWESIEELNDSACPPLSVVKQLNADVVANLPDNHMASVVLDGFASLIEQLVDSIGTCERIKETPMVFGYVATLRSFLMLWLVTLPLALIGEYGWIATPAMAMISFLFLNVEQMALEIEQPFGDDANDLPLEEYILGLETELIELPGRNTKYWQDGGTPRGSDGTPRQPFGETPRSLPAHQPTVPGEPELAAKHARRPTHPGAGATTAAARRSARTDRLDLALPPAAASGAARGYVRLDDSALESAMERARGAVNP